ncbi:hypothetical protein BJV74DRAFT_420153 [Russula compacta]|nr:hypothetical protein BJV74DRAFT_420153 [Russula compacta]
MNQESALGVVGCAHFGISGLRYRTIMIPIFYLRHTLGSIFAHSLPPLLFFSDGPGSLLHFTISAVVLVLGSYDI